MSTEKCKREYKESPLPPSTGMPCELEIDCDSLRDKEARLLFRAMGGTIESRELPNGIYEHTVKEISMTWTTEYPTKPGYYWVRNWLFKADQELEEEADDINIIIAEITPSGDCYFPGQELSMQDDGDILVSGEWYGPIEPPE